MKNRYILVHAWGATFSEEVEAESPEDAIEQSCEFPSVCHQCSNNISFDDCISTVVLDEDGNEVAENKSWDELSIAELTAERDALLAEVETLRAQLAALKSLRACEHCGVELQIETFCPTCEED